MAGTFQINTVAHPTVSRFVTQDGPGREIVITAGSPIKPTDTYRIALLRSLKRNGVLLLTET